MEVVGELESKFRLADPGRTKKKESAFRPVAMGQIEFAPLNISEHARDRVILALDVFAQMRFEFSEVFRFPDEIAAKQGTPSREFQNFFFFHATHQKNMIKATGIIFIALFAKVKLIFFKIPLLMNPSCCTFCFSQQ
jgi:hypothetical protein